MGKGVGAGASLGLLGNIPRTQDNHNVWWLYVLWTPCLVALCICTYEAKDKSVSPETWHASLVAYSKPVGHNAEQKQK